MTFSRTCSHIVFFLLLSVLYAIPALGGTVEKGERPWRVAYVEGGPFSDYQRILRGIALGLQRLGFIENGNVTIPEDSEDAAPMWAWLSRHAGGRKLEFADDGFYSANWDSEQREEVTGELLRRIQEKGDIDMILAFGTWAGQDFASAELDIPVVVTSVTNAVESGSIPSVEDSGKDNLVASIEPERYKQQVILFHNIFNFKKLGIAYEDTPSGRSSIALGEIEKAANELNIDLVRCTDIFDITDTKLAASRLKVCHEQLVQQGADAVYLTLNIGLQPDTTADVLSPLAKAFLPTFSQTGQVDVEHGALLSISQVNTEEEGVFTAQQMAAIMEGTSPGDLSQKYEGAVSLALNLRMATLIGWNPPLEILAAVDEFYQEMK